MGNTWAEFVQSQMDDGAGGADAVERQHRAIQRGVAVTDRADRALLEITGADRASWLHNLTTNEVKNLGTGEGNYAFVLNLKGRILFDINIFVRPDSIFLDLDRRSLEGARQHFDRYTITEDVVIADRSDSTGRFVVVGPKASALLGEMGVTQLSAMPSLGTMSLSWSGSDVVIVRNDFCGAFGVELIAEPAVATALWTFLTSKDRSASAVVVGRDAVDVCRIESGIPWPPHEINDDILPAETGQLARGVSYQKGCYLGQEVVERMRSRGVVARTLCGLVVSGAVVPEPGSELVDAGDKVVGRITSACRSVAKDAVIALAYLKSAAGAPGTSLSINLAGERIDVDVVELPFVTTFG